MKKNKTLEMVQLAVLIAIMLILAFTPLGYLRIGPLAISLMTIPVVIGAMILGPAGGAVLGLVFGLTSFYQCFAGDPFGAALVAMNPFFTFLVRRDLQGTVEDRQDEDRNLLRDRSAGSIYEHPVLHVHFDDLLRSYRISAEHECNRSESVYVRRSILWYQRSTGDAYELCSRRWRCEGSQRSTEEECSDRRAVIESEIYRNEK